VTLDVQKVVNGGNSANHLPTASSNKQLDLRVLMKWVARRIDQLMNVALEWRHPVRIAVIQAERKVYEFPTRAPSLDRLDAD
jgi:hypothetical protein